MGSGTFGYTGRRRIERALGRVVEWCVIVAVLLWGERPYLARCEEIPRRRNHMSEIKLRPDVGRGIPVYVWVVVILVAAVAAGWLLLA